MHHTIDRRSLLGLAGTVAGASLLGVQGDRVRADDVESVSGVSEPRYEIGDPESFYVDVAYENAEGETETPTLYGEVVRPVEDGEVVDDVPVILTYTPYNELYQALNGGESPALYDHAEYFVPRGYARARFDLVGTRNSDGEYDFGGVRERRSGAELVDALGGADWTNGEIGMIGGSYEGTTQLAAAVEAPEHLSCIVPQVAIDRWYDYKFTGGVPYSFLDDNASTPWGFDFGIAATPPRAFDEPAHVADAATTRYQPNSRVEHTLESIQFDPVYDEFWLERDYRIRAEDVPEDCGVFVECGWNDDNVKRWGSTRFFEALPDDHPKRLLVGDWGHGEADYEEIEDLWHAWFDHWLLGHDTGIMDLPPVDTASESSVRTQFAEWPPNRAREVALPLVEGADDPTDLGLVGADDAGYVDDPPIAEPEMFADRASGERHLLFETPPLDEEVRLAGRVTVDLLFESTDDTQITPVVYDRDPDGDVRVVARGFRNARMRNGEDENEDVPTDRAYRLPAECYDADWTFRGGHRIGVVVASDNLEWARNDPRNSSTNEVVLGESTLRMDVGGGDGAFRGAELPSVDADRNPDSRVVVGGEATRIRVEVEAERPVAVRDRVPADWDVVAGDVSTYRVGGATYVEFDGRVDDGTLEYVVEAPGEAGDHAFGPVEYGTGNAWATVEDSDGTLFVVESPIGL